MTSDEPVKKAARRGFTVYYKNKTLLSTVDPVAQSERTSGGITKRDRTLYFCPSPLLGYGLDTLVSVITEDSAVLCVETDKKLLDLSMSSMDKNLLNNPRVVITGIDNGEKLCSYIREKWGPRTFRRVEIIKLSGGWQLDSNNYETMAELIRSDIAVDWGNAMTLVKLGRRFMYNVIRNIAYLHKTMTITDLSLCSKPVLVLGAGPSLDSLLDDLEKKNVFTFHKKNGENNEKKFILVCVDTCLSVLKERKIIPDLAVILESQLWNIRDFIGSRNTGIPAAADLSAYPGTVGLLEGPLYFFFTPWTPLKIFERLTAQRLMPPIVPPLGSVGLCAVELSKRISSGPVLTGGIDFSFTLDKLHARSSPSHLTFLYSHNRLTSFFNAEVIYNPGVFNILSKSNKKVKSNPAMRTYRNFFEKVFINRNIRDIESDGLDLGLETLKIKDAIEILSGRNNVNTEKLFKNKSYSGINTKKLVDFITEEIVSLKKLKNKLTISNTNMDEELDILLNNADYLWAHFPDCAGAEGRRPPVSDLIFLKRVRAEIDPYIKRWEMTLGELKNISL